MKQPIDLTGQRFGRLTVVEAVFVEKYPKRRWLCKCDCGNFQNVTTNNLRKGFVKSCGCLRQETLHKGEAHRKHGMSHSRLYRIWHHMIDRCGNPQNADYSNYGGRGIRVCAEWENDFEDFTKWAMSAGYADELTIDRIDNDGNYCPANCRWVTRKDQNNNRRSNHLLLAFGKMQTLAQWADEFNLSQRMLYKRLARGWGIERALTTPPKGSVPKSDTNN